MEITNAQLDALNVQDWLIVNRKLTKTFFFKDFDDLTIFANKVFDVAKKQNHHPELLLKYNRADVAINNHDEKNISNKCYNFAIAVDLINISPSI